MLWEGAWFVLADSFSIDKWYGVFLVSIKMVRIRGSGKNDSWISTYRDDNSRVFVVDWSYFDWKSLWESKY